jgi:alpha-L-arabinofuranosidase
MATRKKKTDQYEGYTALESYCIGIHEFYQALRKAGFTTDICMSMIMDKNSYPDWLLPKPTDWNPDNPDHQPFEDDED